MGYIGQVPTAIPLTSADITDGTIALADMAANSIDSDQYVDGSIDTAHIATNQIDETLIKDAFVGDFSDVTVTAADTFLYGDATDSGNTKKDTVQGILDLTTGGIWTLIESITPSGTYVSFENKLTATYRTYMIIFEEASSGFSGANGEMHYGTGTSSITWKSSGYYSAGDYRDSNMAGTTVVDADNDSKFVWAALSGTGGGCAINGVMYIFSRVNDYVGYTFHYVNNFSTGYPGYGVSAGHTSLSSITSVRFSYAGTTWGTGGAPKVSLYGLTAT